MPSISGTDDYKHYVFRQALLDIVPSSSVFVSKTLDLQSENFTLSPFGLMYEMEVS